MKKILICFILALLPTFSFAQFRIITGFVWGFPEGASNAEKLLGASVMQKNTTNGTTTSSDGTYSLRLVSSPSNPIQFTASHIGYISQTKNITNSDHCNFVLFAEPTSSGNTTNNQTGTLNQSSKDEKKKE